MGKKLGMTQLFEDGVVVPVTVVEITPNTVVQVKTVEKDGYAAVQLAYGSKKESRLTKPELGHFKKAGVSPASNLQECRADAGEKLTHTVGSQISVGDLFKKGDFIDVSGVSKGKGFQGVMKKHKFAGFENSHGTHEYFRHGGSIGCRLTPGRTFPGMRMPGQMGNVNTTIQNLKVARVDAEANILYVLGAIPGPKGAVVSVGHAKKKLAQAKRVRRG